MKFKSDLERRFNRKHNSCAYEPKKFSYITSHTYCPDFQLSENCFVETKGRFIGTDRAKHLAVRAQNPALRILFVFQDPFIRLSPKSKTTYAEWCDKNGFKWLSIEQAEQLSTSDLQKFLDGTTSIQKLSPSKSKPFWAK